MFIPVLRVKDPKYYKKIQKKYYKSYICGNFMFNQFNEHYYQKKKYINVKKNLNLHIQHYISIIYI